jgi:uncharacterized protein YkwD
VLTLSALLCTSLAGLAHASTYRHRLLRLLNHSRVLHDRRPLRMNLRLSRDALTHTRQMLRDDQLYDVENLASVLEPYNLTKFGADVVGCGESLHDMHRRLMHHALHRRIMLNADLRRVGIGVIRDSGRSLCGRDAFWATELFFG